MEVLTKSWFRTYFFDSMPSLVNRHPDTLEWIPDIATEWAFAGDNKTVYYKLNPKATWSDGKPVTADDFVFILQFMRSKDIVAPWYNDYYTTTIANIEKIDTHTIKVSTVNELNEDDLIESTNQTPFPLHWYKQQAKGHDKNGDNVPDDYVKRMNFKVYPTVGPYLITEVDKGKGFTFTKAKDWWGYTNPYYANRYNVAKWKVKVIRDDDVAFQHFLKGELDSASLIIPSWWRERTNHENFTKGYIEKFWGYVQGPEGAAGLWFNTAAPLLKDINVRKGITYASDMDGMIKNVLFGDYERLPHGLGTGRGKYDLPDAKAPEFDPQKAISFFEQAGFTKIGSDGIRLNDKGERLSFPITYTRDTHTPRLAYLKEQAKQAGLEFVLDLVAGSGGRSGGR